jgi:hypothetical protein
MQHLNCCCPDLPIVAEIVLQVSDLRKPGHCGLPGHDAADAAAKAVAMHGRLVSNKTLGTDFCTCLRRTILSTWLDV